MTVVKSFDLEGNKQSYANWISNLSPCDSPFTSMIGKDSIDQAQYSWQTDALAPANIDSFEEGSDCEFPKRAVTNELTNFTSILRKVINISDTVGAVGTHGRNSEIAYQMKKASKEMMRDLEFMNLNNQDGNPGLGDLASKFFGFEGLVAPYGAVDPDTGAIVHQVADVYNTKVPWFTINAIYDLTTNLFTSGSKADKIMFHPKHANVFSGLLGDCTETPLVYRMFDGLENRFNAKVSKIRDPLGRWYTLIPNRNMPIDKVFIFNEADWTQTILRQPKSVKLGRKGSSEQFMIEMEVGLRHRHHFASGILTLVPGLVMSTHVVPKHIKLNENGSIVCTVTEDGKPVPNKRVAWFSHDLDVVQFTNATSQTNASGVATTTFTGLKEGTYDLFATVDGQIGNMATIVISNGGPVAKTVDLALYPSSIEEGNSIRVSTQVIDTLGHHMANVVVSWKSSHASDQIPDGLTDKDGIAKSDFTPTVAGDGTVEATCEGIVSSKKTFTVIAAPTDIHNIELTSDKYVIPSGDTATMSIFVTNKAGSGLSGKNVTFTIDPNDGATLDPVTTDVNGSATSTFTPVTNSTYHIVANCEGVKSADLSIDAE